MSSSTRTVMLASLLAIGAITLGLTRKLDETESDRPKSPIPTLTRSKFPNRHATVAQLLSSKNDDQDRKSWAKAFNDKDLKRLTLELIDEHRIAANKTNFIPALTALAMEWGRRDFDEMMLECELRVLNKQFGYSSDPSALASLTESLRSAAAAGLAEDDPAEAWRRLNTRTNTDFILIPNENTDLANEVIFRSWAELDPETAWQSISYPNPSAIRGLLAASQDPNLRRKILDWAENQISLKTIPGIPATPGADISNIINLPHSGDQDITRNSIDSILNNPNRSARTVSSDDLRVAVALGIAEHDPVEGFRIALGQQPPQSDDDIPILGYIPLIGRLFQTPASDFLEQLAQRHPEAIPAILENQDKAIRPLHYQSLAEGLIDYDPQIAMKMIGHIDNPTTRLGLLKNGILENLARRETAPWPMISNLPQSLPYDQLLQEISSSLVLLKLPPELDAKAREAIDYQFQRSALLDQTIPDN